MTSQPSSHVTRVLLLGDAGIGKTSLARTITHGVFPSAASLPQDPSQADMEYVTSQHTSIQAGDTSHVIHIFDTVTEDLADGIKIDVIYLCFDVSCQATFDAILTTWQPRVKAITKATKNKAQTILIGLKSDLVRVGGVECQCHTSCSQPITAIVANELTNQIQASVYVEISALKYLGIEKLKEQTVFHDRDTKNQPVTTIGQRYKDKCLLM